MTSQGTSPVSGLHDGPCPISMPTPLPRQFMDRLIVTVDLAATRSVMRELIRLADYAPLLTDEQLRFRLLALAQCARSRPHAPPRSPAGRWSSEAPTRLPAASRHHTARWTVHHE